MFAKYWAGALCWVILAASARAEIGTPVIERGKAATAFVELPGDQGSATAVCIHKSGIFITNYHVVKDLSPQDKLSLVINPGEKNRIQVQAIVLRQDDDCDLAVLRVEEGSETEFQFLELGDDTKLFTTMNLAAFGFPFGKMLAIKRTEYPEISVNLGRVTSLAKKDGKLVRIQLDAQLNPGNSGGPVIDESGAIVGIVRAGVKDAGVNFAIPVSYLRELVDQLEVVFQPVKIADEKKYLSNTFDVELISLLKPLENPLVELELKEADRPARKFKGVALEANRYQFKAQPLLPPPADRIVWIPGTVKYPKGSLTGLIADEAIKVNGDPFKLSELQAIHWQGDPSVRRRDGSVISGKPEGLSKIRLDLGGYVVPLSLDKAEMMELKPVVEKTPVVNYVLTVRQGSETLAHLEGELLIAGENQGTEPEGMVSAEARDITRPKGSAAPLAPHAPRSGRRDFQAVKFVPYAGDKRTIDLPDTVSNVTLAGGGQYVLLTLPKSRKLAVYDANQAKIISYLPMASEEVKVAAGRETLVVVVPAERLIERWSLATFKKETTQKLPVDGLVKTLAMGYASDGPLLIHWAVSTDALARCNYTFFDPRTFREIKVERFQPHNTVYREAVHIRTAATGDVFGLWATSHTPQGLESWVLVGHKVQVSYQHDSAGHVVPNFDGSVVFTGRGGVHTPTLANKASAIATRMPLVPSTHPRFYVSIPTEPAAHINLGEDPFRGQKAGVHVLGKETALADLPDLELARPTDTQKYGWSSSDFTLDKRVIFIPQANQLISVPYSDDRLVVQPFDVRQALESAKVDYFYIASTAPRRAEKGSRFHYPIEVVSRHAEGIGFELSGGPEGMTISPQGELNWDIPAGFPERKTNVIVTIKNSDGQIIYETFDLEFESAQD